MSGGAKGIGLGIDFAIGNQYKRKGGKSYIDPAVLSSVVSVISTYGKTNEDADRSILKDKTGKGNDFKLLNFGFAGNSGYGLYTQYFSSWSIHGNQTGIIKDSTSVKVVGKLTNKYIVYHIQAVASSVFKIKITGLKYSIEYTYNNSGIKKLIISSDGIYDIPASSAVEGSFSTAGFYFDEKYLDSDWTGFTIEIIPDFEGWLCTDGVDDMIVSEKTVDEMIGDSKECTVISIINYISDIAASTNVFGRRYIRNSFIGNGIDGKYYICGYTSKNIDERGNVTVINDILGDKNDFSANYVAVAGVADYFSVTGYLNTDNVPQKCIKIAYAGGFIANKVLTTDEINQIIAYFNLDRPGQIIKPQLYCNIKKQGITNDNHAEFNDQLIDFVGGHNIQLNNIGWEGESGINSYPVTFGANKTWEAQGSKDGDKYYIYTSSANKFNITQIKISSSLFYSYIKRNGGLTVFNKDIPSFKIKVTGLESTNLLLRYNFLNSANATTKSISNIVSDGVHELPKSFASDGSLNDDNFWIGLSFIKKSSEIPDVIGNVNVTIEILPTIDNALCLDGISNFGKATGLPILKDYTVVADRELYNSKHTGAVVSKAYAANNGSFYLESSVSVASFGGFNELAIRESRFMSYQSKYIYNGNPIQVGTGVDSDSMWLGVLRDNDSRFSKLALWSLMLFPYSLSEFLLERQLRKYKAGTLYPGMVEFRPIVKSNIESYTISFYLIDNHGNQLSLLENGKYYDFSDKNRLSLVKGVIKLDNEYIDSISSVKANGIKVDINDGSFYFPVTKSPQKIDITIDRKEVLSNIKNSTWISNEQLIKNK